MLRRLEKRILVDLPCFEARKKMFENLLPKNEKAPRSGIPQLTAQVDYDRMAEVCKMIYWSHFGKNQLTDGYSGADIRLVCKEVAMNCVRKVFWILEDGKAKDGKHLLKLIT